MQYVDHCGPKFSAVFKMVTSATHALGPTQLKAPMDSNLFSYVSQYILREFL